MPRGGRWAWHPTITVLPSNFNRIIKTLSRQSNWIRAGNREKTRCKGTNTRRNSWEGQNTFLFSCESVLRMRANNWNDLLSPHKVDLLMRTISFLRRHKQAQKLTIFLWNYLDNSILNIVAGREFNP